jgi:DNA-binding NarL/FixJ family response regulator
MQKITIFSVDDEEKFQESIFHFFDGLPETYELVGRYGLVGDDEGVEEMLETIAELNPDVVLMDINFELVSRPVDYGIELTKKIRRIRPDQKILMLTNDDDKLFNEQEIFSRVKRSFQAGAMGYIRKTESHTWLVSIQETVKSKEPIQLLPEKLIATWMQRLREVKTYGLTDREIEAIHWLSLDNKIDAVAQKMGIKYEGVVFHLNNAKVRLDVNSIQGLIATAMRQGIIL